MVPAMPPQPPGAPDDEADDDLVSPSPIRRRPRIARHIQPLGPRVLVRILRGEDRSESGLYLPAGAKDNNAEALLGEVIEVARTQPKAGALAVQIESDDDDDGVLKADLGENVSGIPVGAQVLFAKDKGISVPWDDSLRLLAVRYILAIVDSISEDELQ